MREQRYGHATTRRCGEAARGPRGEPMGAAVVRCTDGDHGWNDGEYMMVNQ